MTHDAPAAGSSPVADSAIPPGVDPSRPSPARMYDYYLGGSHNFRVDRDAAERIRASLPDLSDAAWANRSFHQRAARWLAREQRIEQFIDIGSGLPTAGNTHEVVREVCPAARVVYVDIDPMVALYSATLLSGDDGAAVVTADIRDLRGVLDHPDVVRLIDFGEPVGVLMTAVMHFVAPAAEPWGLVRQYMSEVPAGSYLALSHVTADRLPPRAVAAGQDEYSRASENIFLRPREQVERFFEGLELVEPYPGAGPSLCYVGQWGAEDPEVADSDGSRVMYCGVARRP